MRKAKKDIKPGYFNEKPIFRVVKSMKKAIGLQDSCLQTNEAAILYLEEKAKQSGDVEEFITGLCAKYSISLGIRDFDYFKNTLYQSYILQTYNLVEPFFKRINKTYRYYNDFTGDWKTKTNDGKSLDPFSQLLENMPIISAKKIKSYPEYRLLNYYRLVRNSIVHLQDDAEEHKKTNKFYDDNIMGDLEYFRENYQIEAPNAPENISFKDFMLYTRVLKYFSNIINDVCFPSIESLVVVALKDKDLEKKLAQTKGLKYEGALLKRINTVRGFFHAHFNPEFKELRDLFCKAYLDKEGIDYSVYLK